MSVRAEPLGGEIAWTGVEEQPSVLVLAAAAAGGACFDLVVRKGPATAAGTLGVLVLAAALLSTRRVPNPHARTLILAAPVLGAFLMLRTSPWLIPLDLLAIASLVVLGSSLARGGSVFELRPPDAAVRAVHAVVNACLAPAFALAPLRGVDRGGFWRVLRGLALATPVVVVLGVLLASADTVFASLFGLDVDVADDIVLHGGTIFAGAWGTAGLLRLASTEPLEGAGPTGIRLGRTEWTVVLLAVDLVFAAYAAARIVALTEGGRRVLETEGLTYAEYARSGFFQLVAVAAVTLVLLVAIRGVADTASSRRPFLAFAFTTIGLALLVLATAVQRLVLYDRAFGLTMTRLFGFAVLLWIAVALMLLAAWIVTGGRPWFFAAGGLAALALLFTLNVANPEALVVRHNVTHAVRTGHLDTAHLAGLGPDAIPALVAELDRLPPALRDRARDTVCVHDGARRPLRFRYNVSRARAVDALHDACRKEKP